MPNVNCKLCQYYYVTWDQRAPHGCKRFGFKARQLPNFVVRQSSGRDCMAFLAKMVINHNK